jgi:tRNA(fMet)-specific endonuclease VapC
MKYLLDTDICIYFLNRNTNVVEKMGCVNDSELAVSIITLAELQFGAYNSQRVQHNLERVAFLASSVTVLPLTPKVAELYAKNKAALRKAGNPVDDFDILIGTTAIANGLILVTNNEQHFIRMDGVVLENWAK